jgi:aspartate racemase
MSIKTVVNNNFERQKLMEIEFAPRRIGVIGGIGPEASAHFLHVLIKKANARIGPKLGIYPHIIINSIPMPNLFEQQLDLVGLYMSDQIRLLDSVGARLIGIACNTAHLLLPYIEAELRQRVQIIDMIDATVERVVSMGVKRVGLLSTSIAWEIYGPRLQQRGVEVVYPNSRDQGDVHQLIREVLDGVQAPKMAECLGEIALRLNLAGAEACALACTDLPVIADGPFGALLTNKLFGSAPLKLISATEVLADEMLLHAYLPDRRAKHPLTAQFSKI